MLGLIQGLEIKNYPVLDDHVYKKAVDYVQCFKFIYMIIHILKLIKFCAKIEVSMKN